jgi:hypothetical protein
VVRVGVGGSRAVVASAVVVALDVSFSRGHITGRDGGAHLAVGAGALVGVVLVLRHVELLAFSFGD